ncbi:Dynein heavy chain [Glycine soja]
MNIGGPLGTSTLAFRGLLVLAIKGLHVLAIKGLHVLTFRGLHALAFRGLHVLAFRGLHVLAIRGLHALAIRGLFVLAFRGLPALAFRGLHVLAFRGQHALAFRGLHILPFRGLLALAFSGLLVLAFRGLHVLAFRELHALAFRGLLVLAIRGLHVPTLRGLHALAFRRLHVLTFRGLHVLAFRGLHILTFRGLRALTFGGLQVLGFRGLQALTFRRLQALTFRGLHALTFRGLHVLAFRGLHALAFRGLQVLAFRGLHALAFRGLNILTFRGQHTLAFSGLHVLTSRDLHALAFRGLHVLTIRGLHALAFKGLHVLNFRGLPALAFRGLHVLAFRGLDALAFRGLLVLAFRGLHALSFRGLHLLTFRGLHILAIRGLHVLAIRGLYVLIFRGLHALAFSGLHVLTLRGLHARTFKGQHVLTLRWLHAFAFRGLHVLTFRGLQSSTSEEYTPSPSEDYTSSPLEDYKSSASEGCTSSSSEGYMPSPSEGYMLSPSEDYTSSPSEGNTPSPTEDYVSSPLEGYMPSPLEDYTSSPSKGSTPSPSVDYSVHALAFRGLLVLAFRGLHALAFRGLHVLAFSGLHALALRGLHVLPFRWLHTVAFRGLHVLAIRGLHALALRGLLVLAFRGLHALALRGLHVVAFRGLHALAFRGLHVLTFRGLHALSFWGLHVLTFRGLHAHAFRGLHVLAYRGLHGLAIRGLLVLAFRGLHALAFRGLHLLTFRGLHVLAIRGLHVLTIRELHERLRSVGKASGGTIDVLTIVIGRPKHLGRVRAAGADVTIKQYFGLATRTSHTSSSIAPKDMEQLRQKIRDQLEESITEKVTRQVMLSFSQMQSQFQSPLKPKRLEALRIQQASYYLKPENHIKTDIFVTGSFEMGPGSIATKTFENIKFPKGHVGIKSFDAELVDQEGNSIPSYETYLHHWLAIKYHQNITMSPNPKLRRPENAFFQRNKGTCNGGILPHYWGFGVESRGTTSKIPDPFAIEQDKKACTQCRCDHMNLPKEFYNVTRDIHNQKLTTNYKGGLFCCEDNLQCKQIEGFQGPRRMVSLRYKISWVDWNIYQIPVKVYILDSTDKVRSNDSKILHDCLAEYTIPATGGGGDSPHVQKANIPMEKGGYLIYGTAHMHSGVVNATLYGQDGRTLCTSTPKYGIGKEAGNEKGYLIGMSVCYPQPGSIKIHDGEILTLESRYKNEFQHPGRVRAAGADVMIKQYFEPAPRTSHTSSSMTPKDMEQLRQKIRDQLEESITEKVTRQVMLSFSQMQSRVIDKKEVLRAFITPLKPQRLEVLRIQQASYYLKGGPLGTSTLTFRGLQALACKGLHVLTFRGLHTLVFRGLHALTFRGLHVLAIRGLHALTFKGLHALAFRGLHALALVGLHALAFRGLHALTFRGLHVLAFIGLHALTFRGLHVLAFIGLHALTFRGLPVLTFIGLHALAIRGLHALTFRGLHVLTFRGIHALAFRGLHVLTFRGLHVLAFGGLHAPGFRRLHYQMESHPQRHPVDPEKSNKALGFPTLVTVLWCPFPPARSRHHDIGKDRAHKTPSGPEEVQQGLGVASSDYGPLSVLWSACCPPAKSSSPLLIELSSRSTVPLGRRKARHHNSLEMDDSGQQTHHHHLQSPSAHPQKVRSLPTTHGRPIGNQVQSQRFRNITERKQVSLRNLSVSQPGPLGPSRRFLQKVVASGGSNPARLGELGGKHLPYFAINRGGSQEEKEETQEQMKADMSTLKEQMASMMEAMLGMRQLMEKNAATAAAVSSAAEADPTLLATAHHPPSGIVGRGRDTLGHDGNPHLGYNRAAYPYGLPPNYSPPVLQDDAGHIASPVLEREPPQQPDEVHKDPQDYARRDVEFYPPIPEGPAPSTLPQPNIATQPIPKAPTQREAPQVPTPNTTRPAGSSNATRNFPPRPFPKFTPLPMTYEDLLPSLITNHLAVVTPGKVLLPPFPKWYDPNATCKYHGGVPGHSVEKCLALKYKVQHLIDAGWLTFQEDRPNVRTNPLANHGGGAVNAVESDRPRRSKPLRDVATPRRFIFEALQKGGLIPHSGCKEDSCLLHSGELHDMETCLGVEELLQRMIDQGRLEVGSEGKEEQHICMQSTDGSSVAKPKPLVIYFTKGTASQKPRHPLAAKPVPFPYQNSHAVPWRYTPPREKEEEATDVSSLSAKVTNITGLSGVTRSGRVFAPPDLPVQPADVKGKGKVGEEQNGEAPHASNKDIPAKGLLEKKDGKNEVSLEEASEFLRIIQKSEFKVIEQLNKTPARWIPFDADAIGQLLGYLLVLEEGQECEYGQRRNRSDGFDEEAIAQLLCIPGQDFARTAVGRRVRIMRTNMTTLTQIWMTLLLSNILPTDHNSDLPLPKCQLVYAILTRMSVHVAQLIADAIYIFAGEKTPRLFQVSQVIKNYVGHVTCTLLSSRGGRPDDMRRQNLVIPHPFAIQTQSCLMARRDKIWSFCTLLSSRGGGPDDTRRQNLVIPHPFAIQTQSCPMARRDKIWSFCTLLSSRGGGPDDTRRYLTVIHTLLSSRGGGPDDTRRHLTVIRTLLSSRGGGPDDKQRPIWSFRTPLPFRHSRVRWHAETNYDPLGPSRRFLQKAVASGGSNPARLGELGGKHLPYFAINRGGSEEEKSSAP